MKPSQITELPEMLHSLAEDIPALPDFKGLPSIYKLQMAWDDERNTLHVSAQHDGASHDDDLAIIENLSTWAAAIGGVLLLGEEARTSASHGYYWRRLSALAVLPNGLLFEVWDHLVYPVPADASAPELASA